jgi:lipopolysaccharide/colanic/teichoic acid biosynthesis glycosyltransferase
MKTFLSLTLQLLLLLISWLLVGYFSNNDLTFLESTTTYKLDLKFILFISWFATTWLTQKYKPKYYQRKISYVMAPFLKADVIMVLLCWIFLQIFIDDSFDKITIYKVLVIYFSIEFILYILFIIIYNRKNRNSQIKNDINLYKQEDLFYSDSADKFLGTDLLKIDFKYFNKNILQNLLIKVNLLDNSKKNVNLIAEEGDPLKDNSFINILDLRINDLRNIDKYNRVIYSHTLNGGYLFTVYKELVTYEEELTIKKSKVSRFFTKLNYYLFKRAVPKIPYLNLVYKFFTKGKNKVLSKAEVWGRLSYAGFEVEDEIKFLGLSYVLARKVRTPSENPSPSFYPVITLNRVSLYGKIIKIHKLRSMYPYSEFLQKKVFEMNSLSGIGKINDDFRITAFGKLYRKYWIDELPQLFDWLRGEIKLVGIRAMSQHYFSLYSKEYQELFFKVKPGIISPIFDEKKDSFETIQKIEQEYLKKYLKHPLRTDIEYFFKTFSQILKGVRSK